MKILHIGKFNQDKANGIRTVLPNHVAEQAKYEEILFQNVLPYILEDIPYQVLFNKKGWPFNIKDKAGNSFIPDLVIFHGFYHFEMIKLSKVLIRKKIPYIIVPHGSLTKKAQSIKRLKKIVGNLVFFNRFQKKARAIQFLSQVEYDNSKVKNDKFIGTNGCILPSKQKQLFNTDKLRFVYVGRLEYHIKGLDILLDAFKLLMDSPYKDKCELHIYGPDYQGQYAYVKQMIAERSLGEIVTLNSAVFGVDKEKTLMESDIFIQTSRSEGMPMGILEALSYGLPCLITVGTTLGEIINKDNAGWVADTNAQSVFECIVQAIEQKQSFYDKSKSARNLIRENFTWEKIAKDTIKMYRNVIEFKGE